MEKPEPQVVTGRKKLSKKKLLIAIVVAVVLAVCATVAYLFLKPPVEVSLKSDENIPGQLSTLSNEDIDKLAKANANPTNDFSRAHAKAFALSQQGDYKSATIEYKRLVDTGRAGHEVYVEYAAVLYYGGDKGAGIATMETAIQKLKSSDLSQTEKDSTLKIYNNQLQAYKEDNG